MMDVYLHGPLGERFGEKHRFDVRTPMQAVSALDANYPGFAAAFAATERWQVVVDAPIEDGGEIRHGYISAIGPASKEIHLYPLVEGEGALLGALLVSVFPGLGFTIPILGVSAATLLGGLLFAGIAIGLSYLLRPKKPTEPDAADKRENNYAFSGPANVVQQGIALPLIYGRCMVGSVVISAGISTINPVVDTTGSGHGNEVKDNLASIQTAAIIDLLSEGPISGVVNGGFGIYLDGVPVISPDGTLNFSNLNAQFRIGSKNQTRATGFAFDETDFDVGVKLEYGSNEVRVVTNPEVDQVRFTFQIPQLQEVHKESGVVDGATILFRIGAYYGGNLYANYDISISGKTGSAYYWSRIVVLPDSMRAAPWEFRVTRLAPSPTGGDTVVTDDIYWSAYTEMIDSRVFYQWSAYVALHFDAHDFSTIPQRVYDVKGLLILIPSNYDPDTGAYTGVWDGTFVRAWSDNPAWVLYDLIVNNRYGLGKFISAAQIDKFTFYKAGVWCDQKVAGKNNTQERRYTCNANITSQEEAFDLLNQLAAVFRGFMYWNGTQMIAVADQPEDPTAQYTNANVIDGTFTYTGPDIRAINNQITVGWHDRDSLGEGRIAIVEDTDSISRLGIQVQDVPGLGIGRESQAVRIGKWELYTQQYEGETIQFAAGMSAGYGLRPGAIFQVMDANIAGKRRGGRIKSTTGNVRVYFDSPVNLSGGVLPWYLTCTVSIPDINYPGSVGGNILQTRQVSLLDTAGTWAEVASPFGAAPPADSVFVLSTSSLEYTLWRAITVKQTDADRYDVEGVRHYPQKWDYVEKNKAFSEPDISDITVMPPPVVNLRFVESIVQLSSISLGVVGTLSWTSAAPRYEVVYRKPPGNWTRINTQAHQLVDIAVSAGNWVFEVTPIGPTGKRGAKSTLNVTVIGLSAPPSAPVGFRVNVVSNVSMFHWEAAPELDVIVGGHYELRWNKATTGVSWNQGQRVIPAIPGSATSVEAGYRSGTWMLRTFDIENRPSNDWATIISLTPDSGFTQWARICENPQWAGTHDNTTVKQPQNWLTIASAGGGWWDDQAPMIDTWVPPAVDTLPIGSSGEKPPRGWYEFKNGFDAGGIFTIRLTPDILAFPYADPDDFFDSRETRIDTWDNFDDTAGDLNGTVTLYMRTTEQDPSAAGAEWTDWRLFAAGETTARGFQFALLLEAPLGQNIGVETACIIGDFRAKFDHGEDVPYLGVDKVVNFNIKFFNAPSVVITVQDGLATDYITIVSKTNTRFTLRINNPPGTQVSPRTFDWHAQGY